MNTMKYERHPALTDSQTGLPNGLHWDTVFAFVFTAAQRGMPLTVLLLELDGFQEWKSQRSPGEMEAFMAAFASAVRSTTRESDLLARTAEARLALALLDCDLEGGRLVAGRLDRCLGPLLHDVGLSASMGVAACGQGMQRPEDLLEAAEEALGRAGEKGGGRTEFRS